MGLIPFPLIRLLFWKGKVTLKYLQCDYLYTTLIVLRNISVRANNKKSHAGTFNTHGYTEFNAKQESFGKLIQL